MVSCWQIERWGNLISWWKFVICWDREYFYCLPLRRYWDTTEAAVILVSSFISIVYRWGGIETTTEYSFVGPTGVSFLLSTAEAVLRHCWRWIQQLLERISIVYRWGGIETFLLWVEQAIADRGGFLLSTAEAVLRPAHPRNRAAWHDFYCLPLRRYWDVSASSLYSLLIMISIVYRWGGIETLPFF